MVFDPAELAQVDVFLPDLTMPHCATTVPVHVFALEAAHGRLRDFLAALRDSGRIRAMDDALTPFAVTPLRETARVAAEVRTRLDV